MARMAGIKGTKCQNNGNKENVSDLCSNLSYFHSVGENPLVYRTIGQQLSLVAKEDGDREAFVFLEENKRFTFEQLLHEADRLAAGLKCLGLNRGDRIAILAPNTSVWPIALFAAARAGLISVHLNPTPDAQMIGACLSKISAKALIASEHIGPFKYYDVLSAVIPELRSNTSTNIQSVKLPFLTTVIIDSEKNYAGTHKLTDILTLPTLSQINDIENYQNTISPDSGCSIHFTSGFTGNPKAVFVSHFGTVNTGFFLERLRSRNAIACMSLPFCHIFGSGVLAIGCLCNRITLVVPSSMYDQEKILRAISTEKCTFVTGTPKMLMELVSKQKELHLNISNKINVVTGAAPLTRELLKDLKKEFDVGVVTNGFGMTEYSGLCFSTLPDDPDEIVAGTVGSLLHHVEAKIIDDNGNIVPFGTPGELCVRGYPVMIGYWEDKEKTKAVLGADGWLKTGDYFILQPNGNGKIVGRMDEMIKKGTDKIFPKEIENLLESCPSIGEAHVVGVPDENLGEEVCAFICLQDGCETFTLKNLQDFCQGKLPAFHIPRYVLVVKDFPKTLAGKVRKMELKNQFCKQ